MQVINLNTFPIQVKLNTETGVDYVHIVAKRRVTLPEGAVVDANWLASTPNVKLIDTSTN